jgi:NTP pyrophosphatase (non-canonical NTP hydrolase)
MAVDKTLAKEMIEKYGEEAQLDIVVEELSELIKETIKYKRKKSHNEPFDILRIKEELADTMVVQDIVLNILESYGVSKEEVLKMYEDRQARTRQRYLTEEPNLFSEE